MRFLPQRAGGISHSIQIHYTRDIHKLVTESIPEINIIPSVPPRFFYLYNEYAYKLSPQFPEADDRES
jgi:hypothetical protein